MFTTSQVARSLDGAGSVAGVSWSDVAPSGLTNDLNDIHFVDANNGITVGAGSAVYKTNDSGDTWSSVSCGTGVFTGVHLFSASSGIIVGGGGVVKKYTGTGCTVLTSGVDTDLTDVHCVSSDKCWAVGKSSTIITTGNGGDTWSRESEPTGGTDLAAVFMVSVTAGYAVGSGGAVWKYSGTWSALNLSHIFGSTNLNDVVFSGTTGYVIGDSKLLQKTTDGGSNWSSKVGSTPATDHHFRGIMCESSNIDKCFVVTADQAGYPSSYGYGNRYVLRTNDGGDNWQAHTEWEGSWNAVSGYIS